MWNRLLTIWDYVRTSLWFIPLIMVVLGAGLAIVMLRLFPGWTGGSIESWWVNNGNGEDVRNLLSTLLSAVITMASLVFSMTVLALTLAANAYGSRLIRIFRADLRTQSVLGLFSMTIVYCLIVLRSINGAARMDEVPHLAVTVGTALALTCVLALVAFIQGVARSIVADEVVRRVCRDVDTSMSHLPELSSEDIAEHAPADLPADFENKALPIALPDGGYVQVVNYDELLSWTERRNVILRLEFRAGDFIVQGDRLMHVYPAPPDPGKARAELCRFIVIGDVRTPVQDLEYAVRQMVEMALRALSPGINDPFTATVVIDRLRDALSKLMSRRLPSEIQRDRSGTIRIYREVSTYSGILDQAFHQIRQSGSSHPAILIHMLKAIARTAEHARLDEQLRALMHHAKLIRAASLRDVPEPADRDDVEQSFMHAIGTCERALEQLPPD
jgi:uncharacterized membrane protein